MKRYWKPAPESQNRKPAEPQLRIWGLTGDTRKEVSLPLGWNSPSSALLLTIRLPLHSPWKPWSENYTRLPFEWQAAKYTSAYTTSLLGSLHKYQVILVSLIAQWKRNHQQHSEGHRFDSWPGNIPHALEQLALVPQLLSPHFRARALQQEEATTMRSLSTTTREQPPLSAIRSPCTAARASETKAK